MKASYERPLSRADLIALLWHFAGSPYRDRLEQIAAHDDEQREIISAQAREIARLAALLSECNAVCLCGCPESEHESYGEDGESCADEGHECIRVAPAVLEIVQRYRVALAGTPAPRPAQDAVREAAELAHLDLLSYDEAVTGNEKRHALSRCKNALRDVLRTIDAALDAAKGPK